MILNVILYNFKYIHYIMIYYMTLKLYTMSKYFPLLFKENYLIHFCGMRLSKWTSQILIMIALDPCITTNIAQIKISSYNRKFCAYSLFRWCTMQHSTFIF